MHLASCKSQKLDISTSKIARPLNGWKIGTTTKIGTQPNRENCRKDNLTQIWFYHSTSSPRNFRCIMSMYIIRRRYIDWLWLSCCLPEIIILYWVSSQRWCRQSPRLCVFAENISRYHRTNERTRSTCNKCYILLWNACKARKQIDEVILVTSLCSCKIPPSAGMHWTVVEMQFISLIWTVRIIEAGNLRRRAFQTSHVFYSRSFQAVN